VNYIVFDLEFNQDIASSNVTKEKAHNCPFEIIQIGAIKLDTNYHAVASFNRLVKPTIYPQVNPFIADLTGITIKQLLIEEPFPRVFHDFMKFIEDKDSVFCIWGMSDMKELFRNVNYHELDQNIIPDRYINLQPYVSTYLNLPQKKLLKLQTAVETLNIDAPHPFHNALYDAYYTAKIFKKINNPMILPMQYHPNYSNLHPRQHKKTIDFEKLLLQFEKMYARELSKGEQEMVKLAYQMGKTQQFLKSVNGQD